MKRSRGGDNLIRYGKIRLTCIIAVLQRRTHKLYFVLVPGDL